MNRNGVLAVLALMLVVARGAVSAQAGRFGEVGAAPAAPSHSAHPATDPAAATRGKQLYSANCAFCHGSDAHGGEGGPNLLRSAVVSSDRNGEMIAAVVQNGRIEKGMPKFNMTSEQVADIATFVHSMGANGQSLYEEQSILVGNAEAGKAYFNGKGGCTACHSVTGDLVGIASRLGPKSLQDSIATGGGTGMLGVRTAAARPRTVRVILPSGPTVEGNLESLDDFHVTLIDATGNRRTVRRNGNIPRVEVHDPYEVHNELLKAGRDEVIHDLTAYLATLK